MANLIPPILDSYFKHIIDEVDTKDVRLLLYFLPGLCSILILMLAGVIYRTIGSRLGLMLGGGLLTGACYLFWPLNRKEIDSAG